MAKIEFLELLGKALTPDKLRLGLSDYSRKAGLENPPYAFFGILFLAGFVSMILAVLGLYSFLNLSEVFDVSETVFNLVVAPLFFLLSSLLFLSVYFFIIISFIMIYFDFMIFKRVKQMEENLPGFLKSISENLKGGTTFEQAFWNSIRPDYGELAKELQLVAKRIAVGESTSDAMLYLAGLYDSDDLSRTFSILSESLQGGTRISPIVDKISSELENTSELKKDISATNLSYVMFIVIIACFVSPFLFALSNQFLLVLEGFVGKMESASIPQDMSHNMLFSIGGVDSVPIAPSEFTAMAYVVIIVTGVFSSMIVAIIREGNIRAGIKYMPAILAVAVFIFTVLNMFLTGIFGTLMG
jgi:flagellar protein FlaJ